MGITGVGAAVGAVGGIWHSIKEFNRAPQNQRTNEDLLASVIAGGIGGALVAAAFIKGTDIFIAQPGLALLKCISQARCSSGDYFQISLLAVPVVGFWGAVTLTRMGLNQLDAMAGRSNIHAEVTASSLRNSTSSSSFFSRFTWTRNDSSSPAA